MLRISLKSALKLIPLNFRKLVRSGGKQTAGVSNNRMTTVQKISDKGEYLVDNSGQLLFLKYLPDQTKNFFSYDTTNGVKQIDEAIFSKAIGGDSFQTIEKLLGQPIHDFVITEGLNGQRYLSAFHKDSIFGFDKSGQKIYELKDDFSQGHAIYDIKFEPPHFLWIAYPTGQTVTKISLETNKEIFKIGNYTYDEVYEPLSYPESLFITDRHLFISNMGNNKLFKLDLKTYDLQLVTTFADKIWEYIKIGQTEFVRSDNGVFIVGQ